MSALKTWNWQKKDWPNFLYDEEKIEPLEQEYTKISAEFRAALKYISIKERNQITLHLLSEEALETSSIEGEMLDRRSVQSSLQRHLGINPKLQKARPQEADMAELMMSVFNNFSEKLSHKKLHYWNKLITQHSHYLENSGSYRQSREPMQVISGPFGKEKIHFEAPPSGDLDLLMENFINWFNESEKSISPMIRASIAHLYFVSIHPYEDGNGRISRILVEKSLSQYQESPALTNISREILAHRKDYYDALAQNNRSLEITSWIEYMSGIILKSIRYTLQKIDATLEKTRLYDTYKNELNVRQIKVLEKLFAVEPEGFKGGLSAENYIAITDTSRATATRDLQNLVRLEILRKEGERRYTRYYLEKR